MSLIFSSFPLGAHYSLQSDINKMTKIQTSIVLPLYFFETRLFKSK